MIIERTDHRDRAETVARPLSRRLLLSAVAIAAISAGLGFGGGFAFRDFIRPSLQALTGRTGLVDSARTLARAPARWIEARIRPPNVEQIHLDIKFADFEKLRAKRKEALERGLRIAEDDDMVPAELRHRDRTVKVQARLKGDLTDHLAGDKWSLRIHVRGGAALFGLRRFSIQAPETRGFQAEPLFLAALRDEGVLAPRYSFLDVVVNGNSVGLMALEEHFSKELLESQSRREGVILKFDESPFWANVLANGSHGPYENYRTARIGTFGEGRIQATPELAAQYDEATGLLRGFVEGDLRASEVFDEELVGRFLAVCEFFGSSHSVRWHNLRLYFNPVDRELEPIGFDGNLQAHYLGNRLLVLDEPIARDLLEDPGVRDAYVGTLRRLAEGLIDGTLVARWSDREVEHLRILQREYPARGPIDWSPLISRADALRRVEPDGLSEFEIPVPAPDADWPLVVDAALVVDGSDRLLELRNPLPFAVVVESLDWSTPADSGGSTISARPEIGLPIRLAPTLRGGLPDLVRLPLRLNSLPREQVVAPTGGTARIAGTEKSRRFVVRSSAAARRTAILPEPSIEDLLRNVPFLERDPDASFLRIRPGVWSVGESLILPDGIGLRAFEGTSLRFSPEASLIVRGPLEFLGTAEAPIVLEPETDSDHGGTWRGVVVLSSARESHWRHVQVRSTDSFRLGNWALTGGVTFFESEVRLEKCRFTGHRGEDALNVIRTRAKIVDPWFSDTPSDAFDGDFVEGSVEGGLFERIGGDGVDVSGADFFVKGTKFRDIRDKAISVGEGSRLTAEGILVERSGTGMASKDRSHAEIRDALFRDIEHVTLMAYMKKPEFGASALVAERVRSEGGSGQLALAQIGSRVEIDGVAIPESKFDSDRVYQEGYMKK